MQNSDDPRTIHPHIVDVTVYIPLLLVEKTLNDNRLQSLVMVVREVREGMGQACALSPECLREWFVFFFLPSKNPPKGKFEVNYWKNDI